MKYYTIEIAFGDKKEADETTKKVLDLKLAGSSQIIESNSMWNWQNERESAKEYLVILKTKEEHIRKIYEIVKDIHSYDCFEFAMFEMTSINQDYLKWIDEETK